MFIRSLIATLSVLYLASSASARDIPGTFADLVEKLSPSVVNISTTQKVKTNGGLNFKFHGFPDSEMDPFKEFFERFGDQFNEQMERDVTSLGSGFVIDPSGYIVTNNHVVEQADGVTVTFQDETQYEAKIVGSDKKTDLALLKIDAKKELPFVRFGNSDDVRVGDWVIAIGNPFGLGGSVSAGIVSARSRNINAGPFDDFIQTDAAINRGNSGGPLFDVNGNVIGVNSAIFSPSGGNVGIGFSIPSALAQPVLKQLKEFGRTHRGWLGVKIQHVTIELAESLGLRSPKGALVLEVTDDSPADKAGVKAGDVILTFDGREVEEMRQLPRMVAETKIGKEVELEVWRDEDKEELRVTLGELEEEDAELVDDEGFDTERESSDVKTSEWMGAQVAALNATIGKRLGIGKDVKGVVVLKVEPNSSAFDAKLQRGDVITEANQRSVHSVEELKDAIEDAKDDDKSYALLRINRRGTLSFITIRTK